MCPSTPSGTRGRRGRVAESLARATRAPVSSTFAAGWPTFRAPGWRSARPGRMANHGTGDLAEVLRRSVHQDRGRDPERTDPASSSNFGRAIGGAGPDRRASAGSPPDIGGRAGLSGANAPGAGGKRVVGTRSRSSAIFTGPRQPAVSAPRSQVLPARSSAGQAVGGH